jgi:Alr-MurF fusion protein
MLDLGYRLEDIAQWTGAQEFRGDPNFVVKDILIDSRRLIDASACLFFALPGKHRSGEDFVESLYSRGVRAFVVTQVPEGWDYMHDASFILARNPLRTLQKLAARHRSRFHIPIIGITGSNGKTIIKEWLSHLLGSDQKVVRSPKSFNSQVGVPLSVLQIQESHDLGIFEAGISEPQEMQALADIIKPDIGIFTNLGQAHDENFLDRMQKSGEKLKLFTGVETLIICADHRDIHEAIIKTELSKKIKLFTWSRKRKDADLLVETIEPGKGNTQISVKYGELSFAFQIPFTDLASQENAMHCAALMLLLGYEPRDIVARMPGLSPVAMRLELKEGIRGCTIINDAYNSDFNSLSIAIDFLLQQNQHGKRTVILSDILQSGQNEMELYSEVARLLEEKHIERIIGIGHAISRQAGRFNINKAFFPDTQSFLKHYPLSSFDNEAILLKGARIFEFELINKALQQKSHQTLMEINLNAIVHNLNHFRSMTTAGTGIMAMVKAFSYGSGTFEVANMLQFHHVDYLAVAYADEGVALREAGIRLPIMVMSPEDQGMDTLIKNELEPEVFSFRTLGFLEDALHRSDLTAENPIKVHIELNTGMNRIGFDAQDLDQLCERLKANSLIRVETVFSHLAAAENPALDEFTRGQIQSFRVLSDRMTELLGYSIRRHILNSAGVERFPEASFEMVRLGIGLYGIGIGNNPDSRLENVATLRTIISQIRILEAQETVGYSRAGVLNRPSRIGTIPLGYADGLSRSLSQGIGHVWVKGKRVPIVGNVCMDMTMIDLTDTDAHEGDEVIVFGRELPVQEMAIEANTIPYEILSRISRRVKRVYYHE